MKKITFLLLNIPLRFLFLFSRIMIRDKRIIVFGVHTNTLFGNVKELLERSGCSDVRKIFIGRTKKDVADARSSVQEAYWKYSLKGIWYSLKAGGYLYSSYPSDINYWLSGGARYINVWHGTPIKRIERDVTTGYYALRNRFSWMYRIFAPYLFITPDAMLVASDFEKQCLISAFGIDEERCVEAYPPRLQYLERERSHITETVSRKVLYVPTWRDDHSFVLHEHVDLVKLNNQLISEDIEMYVKAHPVDQKTHVQQKYSNIYVVDKDIDVYELLAGCDLLLTDYSSMMFEALYLNIAVILFCPDLDHYRLTNREFYIDPCQGLPVTSVYSGAELGKAIISRLNDFTLEVDLKKKFMPYTRDTELLCRLMNKAYKNG